MIEFQDKSQDKIKKNLIKKPFYHFVSDTKLKKILKDLELPYNGERHELIKLHQKYVDTHNKLLKEGHIPSKNRILDKMRPILDTDMNKFDNLVQELRNENSRKHYGKLLIYIVINI